MCIIVLNKGICSVQKYYSLLEQVPISVADSNALAVRNYEDTE